MLRLTGAIARRGMPMTAYRHCQMMRRALRDKDAPLVFSAKLREYGIRVLDGGSSYIAIYYCPWCGKKLPGSLRKKWMRQVRKLGFEPGDEGIPKKFNSGRWYSTR
jgi:hypothetical protein